MENHRNGYPLVQIYRAKIKMLLYSVWCNRVLSIHYRKKFRRSHSICQSRYRDSRKKTSKPIKHCRKSFLYHEDEPWKKKESESRFDVTIGSKDGAKICELTGVFILSQLSNLLPREDIALYWDDGVILLWSKNVQLTDISRKNVINFFKEIGFQIEIETNLKFVNFLDVTFSLASSTYRPHRKPNDNLFYLRTSSNHSPKITGQTRINIKPCNLKKKDECPLNWQCLAQDNVYKCIA